MRALSKRMIALVITMSLVAPQAFALSPENNGEIANWYALGNQYLRQKNYSEAITAADKILVQEPSNVLGYELLIKAFLELHNLPALVLAIRTAQQHGLRNLSLYKMLARSLFTVGGFAPALDALVNIEEMMEERSVGNTLANKGNSP